MMPAAISAPVSVSLPMPEVAALQRRLDFLLHHDALTCLPNRARMRQCFERAAVGGARLALMALDLLEFLPARDNIGHEAGEQLLLQAAERLQACLRGSDVLGHLGGSEFVILLADPASADAAQQVGAALQRAFAEPFLVDGLAITLPLCIGIGLFPDDGRAFDEVQRAARIAVAHAADNGRDHCIFCTAQMRRDTAQRLRLQAQLRGAVVNRELMLHYQPQIAIGSGRVVGVEALLRWRRPDGTLVYPGSFIPLAERSGLIVPMGVWVLNEACRQARAWEDSGLPALTVAVNLSALQFRFGNIVATVADALDRHGLPPSRLELELTESILLHDSESVNVSLQALKAMGVALSIDDFGTGYSNLSYLKSLAVDKLKIDQSFVRGLGEDAGNSAIVKAIVQLGHTLQLSVLAEGVESAQQLALLESFGCDEVQGYLFSKPMEAVQLAGLLVAGQV